jgi:hypothetical protein
VEQASSTCAVLGSIHDNEYLRIMKTAGRDSAAP